MSAEHQGNISGPTNKAAFAFVQALALEMSAGKIEIPSFPDVAVRVRKVLADENCSAMQIADSAQTIPSMSRSSLSVASGCVLTSSASRTRSILIRRAPPIGRAAV